MTVSARDVAAVLRDRLPELSVKKLHKLLYYCQGHHLATFEAPLFAETIHAWDGGPVVGALWRQEATGEPSPSPRPLGEAELNTIGYVLSRYGNLTGNDLENLTRNETPWESADRGRSPLRSVPIELESLTHYFQTRGAQGTDDAIPLDGGELRRMLEDVMSRPPSTSGKVDTREEILARMRRES
ncbi:Panacea domain-containing protein [Winogradskya humida]|uniref:Antitoxin SocA-like Panacea domain-containing protein n=1 Tax=Winogradskya humida TaxID=113566 RepID=A0ABQ3ZMX6_9ACTN|nr:type II toxin-antitoxin system antitoxin SocA domain-containing protein [Actinoplanes humidus]GIE19859.1 hypothetical protein Ahu01nite_029610 [Actinoplanes humidus]